MTYKQSLEFLYYQLPMFQRVGPKAFKKDLKNIKQLLSRLGNPEKELRAVHIAGTNGKGTSAHLLASMIQTNELKVGLYTSPHYKDFRERIKINGSYIDKKYVRTFTSKIKGLIEKEDIKASFFEITVAMAFSYFAEQKVDYAVIETGLGGRLDSTNVLKPVLSLITNISFDHTQFLGNTLPKIAKEKAGIIKKGIPVVVGEHQLAVADVFKSVAEKKETKITWGCKRSYPGIKELKSVKENGPFFIKNVRSALASYQILTKQDERLSSDKQHWMAAVDSFVELTKYQGRWQVISEDPKVIVDSAHNQAGLQKVVEHLKSFSYNQLHIVFGMVDDKDPEKVYELLPKNAQYYLCAAAIPRAKSIEQLKHDFDRRDLNGKTYKSCKLALVAAKQTADQGDLVLVLGSIFVVAEVID